MSIGDRWFKFGFSLTFCLFLLLGSLFMVYGFYTHSTDVFLFAQRLAFPLSTTVIPVLLPETSGITRMFINLFAGAIVWSLIAGCVLGLGAVIGQVFRKSPQVQTP